MNRKNFGPGLAVLTLTAALALAGARPAAAQDFGFFLRGVQWLAALWSSPVKAMTLETGAVTTENATTDKGLGVDPNGSGTAPELPHLGGN